MTLIRHFKAAFALLIIPALWGGATLQAEGADGDHAKDGQRLIYVGTYSNGKSKGIYACRMNETTGALTPLGLEAETQNPTFLAIDPKHDFLFAVNEIGRFEGKPSGAITVYSMDKDTGKLTTINQHTSIGSGPCHVVLDRAGRDVLVANYGSGSIAVFPVQTGGRLGDNTAFIQDSGKGVNPSRQEGPHAHCMVLDAANRFAFACDLGLDKIMIYRFDSAHGTLTPNEPAFETTPAGSGPRHLAFGPDGRHAYVIHELNSTIAAYAYDHRRGSLKELQTVSMLPENFKGENIAAEIEVHPSGKFLYGSNRGHDSIVVFTMDRASGRLTLAQDCPTLGKTPRHFAIDPTGRFLLAANQDSDDIVVFAIDAASGRLTATGEKLEVPRPTCVVFAGNATN